MNNNYTSINKKGIEFKEFPNHKKNFFKDKYKLILVISFFIIISLFSTYLNLSFLNKKDYKYKIVSEADKSFEKIKEKNQKQLFENIGFDGYTVIDVGTYNKIYAYKRIYEDIKQVDYTEILYDKSDNIFSIDVNLIISKKDDNSDVIYNNLSNIIGNFTNKKLNNDCIKNIIENKNEMVYNDITYIYNDISSKFYMINVIIEK